MKQETQEFAEKHGLDNQARHDLANLVQKIYAEGWDKALDQVNQIQLRLGGAHGQG